jgi:RNA polymerase sigma factor (sigma-70 family)
MSKKLDRETEYEYVEKAKTDPHYFNLILTHFDSLIKTEIIRYSRPNISEEDLYQQGVLGISRAIQDFQPKKKKRFSTYARWWVKALISEFYRNNRLSFSVSGALSLELNSIIQIEAYLENELGRLPTKQEIAKEKGISVEKLTFLYKYKNKIESFSAITTLNGTEFDEGETLGDKLADDHIDNPLERLIRVDCINCIQRAVTKLPEIQQKIINSRYGLNGCEVKTLGDIAKSLDLSSEYVRQIQDRAEYTLRLIIDR